MKALKVIGVLAVVCLVGIVALVLIGGYLLDKERDAVKKAYGSEVAKMCDPAGGGAADSANMPSGERPLQLLVLDDGDSTRHDWHKDLPSQYKADDQDELDVVVCVKERTETLEKCPYTTSDDTKKGDVAFTVDRKQHFADLVLLNGQTGRRISELTVEGELPGPCPSQARSTTPDITGKDVSYNDFLTIIEPIITQ